MKNQIFERDIKRSYSRESNQDKEYKGIYSYECDINSMEEFIIKLFWDKLNTLPIAQNVLITSKETSEEEIQAFIYRAILCNYNTLFVIEISDSFTEHQQNIMNLYIEQSLADKKNKADKNKDTKCEKSKTEDYMDSCLLFIYGKEYKEDLTTFSKEIKKLEPKKFIIDKIECI